VTEKPTACACVISNMGLEIGEWICDCSGTATRHSADMGQPKTVRTGGAPWSQRREGWCWAGQHSAVGHPPEPV
jgi:hypothetical protein